MITVSKQPFDPGPAAWNEILPSAMPYPKLDGDIRADFLVIGGGFAGLSTARRLKQLQPDAAICVVEARRIAEGPAGRNSGFMIDLPHNLASKDYAGDAARDRSQTALNREAIAFAAAAAEEYAMPQEAFSPSGKINAAATERGVTHNQDYAQHLASMGEAHELLDATAMRAISGSDYYLGGLFTPGTAMLQPALYVRGLGEGLAASGVLFFENTPVTSLNREGTAWRAATPTGNISAGAVILCVNGHAESFGFFKRRLMHIYLYASMTRALTAEEAAALGGERRWGFTPADPLGTTVRRISGTGGERIVVRNRFTWAPGRSVDAQRLRPVAHVHDRSFSARFPCLAGVEMAYRWGGLLCLSLNTAPAFGELEPGLFSACCQNGLGTAAGTLSGKLIAEQICGHESASLSAMQSFPAPKRLPPEPFASIGANATMRWGEMRAGKEL
ncbi:NAD(P)/FAD-dependent oxidoreductase [Hoeflea sp.]|uniref:NAD(P)/FAD-dependent oxidoreductase n=1 Tax=Hoeflea sp. TaxID=1940281 RepID=UPI003B024093